MNEFLESVHGAPAGVRRPTCAGGRLHRLGGADQRHYEGLVVGALGEQAASRRLSRQELLAEYLGQLIPAIQQAIIDDDESVRSQASTATCIEIPYN